MHSVEIYHHDLSNIREKLSMLNALWTEQFSSDITMEFPDEFELRRDGELIGSFVNEVGDEWAFRAAVVEDSKSDLTPPPA